MNRLLSSASISSPGRPRSSTGSSSGSNVSLATTATHRNNNSSSSSSPQYAPVAHEEDTSTLHNSNRNSNRITRSNSSEDEETSERRALSPSSSRTRSSSSSSSRGGRKKDRSHDGFAQSHDVVIILGDDINENICEEEEKCSKKIEKASGVVANENTNVVDLSGSSSLSLETGGGVKEDKKQGKTRLRILDLNGKSFEVWVDLSQSVLALKKMIEEEQPEHVAVRRQRLIYRGMVLVDEKSLQEYKLEDGHTIHLFARQEVLEVEEEGENSSLPTLNTTHPVVPSEVHSSSERHPSLFLRNQRETRSDGISTAIFPSDIPRIDPLMLDTSLGAAARRVKLWSSFILVIYTMKSMGQFAMMAKEQPNNYGGNESRRKYGSAAHYLDDPMMRLLVLFLHIYGVYVGCAGLKASHGTNLFHIQTYCRGLILLSIFTLAEQIYLTAQISEADFPTHTTMRGEPSWRDVVTANILQVFILAVMWSLAILHAIQHFREVIDFNQTLPVVITSRVVLSNSINESAEEATDAGNQAAFVGSNPVVLPADTSTALRSDNRAGVDSV